MKSAARPVGEPWKRSRRALKTFRDFERNESIERRSVRDIEPENAETRDARRGRRVLVKKVQDRQSDLGVFYRPAGETLAGIVGEVNVNGRP